MGDLLYYPTVTRVLSKTLEPQDLLFDVLCQLNAPGREFRVEKTLLDLCKKQKISAYQDSQGNIWVNSKSERQTKDAKMVVVSHLDHPGIRIDKFEKKDEDLIATGVWEGGGPLDIEGARVWVFGSGPKETVLGKIIKATYKEDRPNKVTIKLIEELPNHAGDWGACFSIPTEVSATEIRTRSADDLISVCADIQALVNAGVPEGIVLLLSHSEEVHLEGTSKLLKKNPFPKEIPVLVVDTTQGHSKDLGKGIVIRSGDTDTEYSPDQTQQLSRVLKSVPHKILKTQGRTEGTTFKKHGYDVGSLALPILHQHNVGWNQRPVAETVNVRDYEYLVQAIEIVMQNVLSRQSV